MSAPPLLRDPDTTSTRLMLGMLLVSVAGHVLGFLAMPDRGPPPPPIRRVEMEFYEPPPPKPVEPPKVEEPPKPVEPPRVKVKPPPVKLAEKVPPPKEDAPPPPNDTPPPEATKPVPIVVGISMSSTTAAGGFAVQVGNTTYGKASDTVVDPSQVKAYAAPKYVPPGGADTDPVPLDEPRIPYPEEARKNDVEGSVSLRLTIDPQGTVTEVVVLKGPGFGLNEAARDALKRRKFKPATKGGEPVGTSIVYTYTFLLD